MNDKPDRESPRRDSGSTVYPPPTLYREIFEQCQSAFALLKPVYDSEASSFDFEFIHVNPGGCKLFQLDADDYRYTKLTPAADMAGQYDLVAQCQHAFHSRSKVIYECPIDIPTVPTTWHLHEILFLEDHIAIHSKDITGQKALESRSQKHISFLEGIINACPDPIFVKDRDHRWILVNDGFCQFMGRPREELLGKSDYDFSPGHEAEVFWQEDELVFRLGATRENEESFTDRHEKIHTISTRKSIFRDSSNGLFLVGTIRDVTEQKLTADALKQATQEAEIASKAKSQFLANMSHEVRTPMNGIIGTTELLLDSGLNEQQQEFAQMSLDSANMLLEILNSILDLSRIEAGKLSVSSEPFNLRSMVEDISKLYSTAAAKRKISILHTYSDEIGDFFAGDAGRIRQVLCNFIDNALKFTDEGSIQLTVEPASDPGPFGRVRMTVVDTGIGIPADQLLNLFSEFYQVDGSATRKYGGTGLGLAISHRLTQLMEGTIGVSSKEGEGSRFWFELPLRPVCVYASNKPEESSEEVSTADMKFSGDVLLAEDNAVNQDVISKILEHLGLNVDVAANGREVLEKLSEKSYQIIFMDCQMPGIDGYEATQLIRAMQGDVSHVPIIALTAHAMAGDREKCLEAGMNDYLTKPIDRRQLARLIQEWFEKINNSP